MRRQLAIGALIALAATLAYWEFTRLAGAQTPRIYFDSQAYFQIAQRPLGLALLSYAKPPIVPLIYRASSDPETLRSIQVAFALVAWTALAFALGLAMRRTLVRVLAAGVAIAFLLAAPRVGWTAAILSESINDSLLALVIAGALALATAERRRAIAIATGIAGIAWIFTRDTNAITALVAVAVAAIVWRSWWRFGVALAVAGVIAAIVTLAATRVAPAPLEFQGYWRPDLTSRAAYPMIDNILVRVLPDDRDWLVARDVPVADLERVQQADWLVQAKPENATVQDWILAHGTATYVRWLVRHPIDRIAELGRDWGAIFAARHTQTMPSGWTSYDHDVLRRLTTNRWIVLALLLASPALLYRPRRDARRGLALCLVVSGLAGILAAYYGDAVELSRHCYGSSQQVILGLFVALLVWLDDVHSARERPAAS